MTTILGAVSNEGVVIGADSQSTDSDNYAYYDTPKLFQTGQLLVAVAGDCKALYTLQFLPASKFQFSISATKFMLLKFPRLIEEFLDQHELVLDPFSLLVSTKGQLFLYESDDNSVSPIEHSHAIGSGASFARGAFHVLQEECLDETKHLVYSAIRTAMHFDAGTGGNITVATHKGNTEIEYL